MLTRQDPEMSRFGEAGIGTAGKRQDPENADKFTNSDSEYHLFKHGILINSFKIR